MKTVALCLSLFLLLGLSGCGRMRNPEAEAAAITVAEQWTALLDVEDYSAAWQETALLFREAVSEAKWLETMEAVRKPLGANISRTVKSARYQTALPAAPDEEYVIVQFKCAFANKASTTETITPMLEKDGTWRVTGYYIK